MQQVIRGLEQHESRGPSALSVALHMYPEGLHAVKEYMSLKVYLGFRV